MKKEDRISRREFISKTAAHAAVAGISLPAMSTFATDPSGPPLKNDLDYRKLGRTKLSVSAVSFGAMTTSDPAVIRRGVDLGINYIDTARAYMKGENEKIVATALKGIPRDKIYIATKIPLGKRGQPVSKPALLASAEESLKALNTDYVDVLFFHNLTQKDQVLSPEALDALSQLKKDGKVRFTGVSTHNNVAGVADAAVESEFFDVVLAKLNFMSSETDLKALERASKAGLGIVAMKTQAGGRLEQEPPEGLSTHPARLKWALQHAFVSNAIPGMRTIQQVEDNFKVMENPTQMSGREKAALKSYANRIESLYCRLCGECEGDCPHGAPVAEINRCVMYADGYRDEGLARQELAALGHLPCADCSGCSVVCRNSVDVAAKIERALSLIA
jgi:predicted aldo/keto reductase-like oxidoreductase